MREVQVALTLVLGLSVAGCDSPEPAAGVEPSPSVSASPSYDPDKLDCDGEYSAAGVFDYAPSSELAEPNEATPASIAEGFRAGSLVRGIKGWNLDDPPPYAVEYGQRGKSRFANVYFRYLDGPVIAILDLAWSREDGWRLGGEKSCVYGPNDPRPKPSAIPEPGIIIDRTLFSPRVQRKAFELDCDGGSTSGMTTDRAPNPNAKPLVNPDAATDGLAAYARQLARRYPGTQSWEGSHPPATALMFPGEPADSMRAVVRLTNASGKARVAYLVARDVARGAWHVESYQVCT